MLWVDEQVFHLKPSNKIALIIVDIIIFLDIDRGTFFLSHNNVENICYVIDLEYDNKVTRYGYINVL